MIVDNKWFLLLFCDKAEPNTTQKIQMRKSRLERLGSRAGGDPSDPSCPAGPRGAANSFEKPSSQVLHSVQHGCCRGRLSPGEAVGNLDAGPSRAGARPGRGGRAGLVGELAGAKVQGVEIQRACLGQSVKLLPIIQSCLPSNVSPVEAYLLLRPDGRRLEYGAEALGSSPVR